MCTDFLLAIYGASFILGRVKGTKDARFARIRGSVAQW